MSYPPDHLFKVLAEDGSCRHGGTGSWHLPQNGKPGKWMPKLRGELSPCERGYHLLRAQDLSHWLGPALWTAEYDGDRVDADNKVVVRKARLVARVETYNDKNLRLFACDCAERALLRVQNPDPRSVAAIEVARRYAVGAATDAELANARSAAPTAGASAVAWAAATAMSAAAGAYDAAYHAAYWAAVAAWDAAAERRWQSARLWAYINDLPLAPITLEAA